MNSYMSDMKKDDGYLNILIIHNIVHKGFPSVFKIWKFIIVE